MRRWLVLFLAVLAIVPAGFAGNVAGKWKFAFQTPRGVLEVPVVLKINGEKVTATSGHIQIDGTFRQDHLDLSGDVYTEQAGYEAPVRLTGNLTGNEIRGDVTFDLYESTFIATREE